MIIISMCDTGRAGGYPDVFLYKIKKTNLKKGSDRWMNRIGLDSFFFGFSFLSY